MKIAFVVPGFAADEHDWCIPAHTDIVRALAQTNEVHVFALRYPHRVAEYKIGNAVVHSFNGVGSRGVASARLWLRVLETLAREHARARFDIVHAIFASEAGCVAVLAGKFLRVPSVVWMVDGELIGLRTIGYGADLITRQRRMNHFVLRFADCVLCGCETTVEQARERSARGRIELLPLGVNLERFSTSPLPSPDKGEGVRFVNVGSLIPVKDQTTLLRAFALVRKKLSDARLTIAGVGPLENALRALARELGIAESVTFAGSVRHDELANVYRSADVFVQASHHEGQGMALLEAAACGCAVCGTNVGALRDMARGGGAIACAVGDADALARVMMETWPQREHVALRGREIVAREYALTRVVERLTTLYRQRGGAA